MLQKFILLKGILTNEKLEILEVNKKLEEEYELKIKNLIFKKIPKFVFEKTVDPRTMIFEDALGYSIIKFFYIDEKIVYLLIRIEGKFYTSEEIKKISLKVNQFLDPNLNLSLLSEKVQEIIIRIETYDFSRPIKSEMISNYITAEEKRLKIDDLLLLIDKFHNSEKISDLLQFYKYKILLNYQKRKLNQSTPDFSKIYNDLMSLLENYNEKELNQYDIASLIFNFALILKDLSFIDESNDAFSKAATRFKELQIDNLQIFSIFNIILNFKQLKKFDNAFSYISQIEKLIYESKFLSNGFKGIFFRHLAELYHLKQDFNSAKKYYHDSLTYFEKDKQINIDAGLNYLALGTINYNERDYFSATKYFAFAANIFSFLNQDIGDITKNLGLAFLNHSHEYLKTIKILMIEKDFEKLLDLYIKGLSYLLLSNFHLGNQLFEKFNELYTLYLRELEKIMIENIKEEERRIGRQIQEIIKEHYEIFINKPEINEIKKVSKNNYEKMKKFQPLKTYYFMVIYKHQGLPIYSKTSTILKDLPTFDENLIAGLITAMDNFLDEVLTGEENLALIDRDNIKIIFEFSNNLIGVLFVNKENPQIRNNLKNLLQEIERNYKHDFEKWTGEITKFSEIKEMASKIII